jgi:hypothetical protein
MKSEGDGQRQGNEIETGERQCDRGMKERGETKREEDDVIGQLRSALTGLIDDGVLAKLILRNQSFISLPPLDSGSNSSSIKSKYKPSHSWSWPDGQRRSSTSDSTFDCHQLICPFSSQMFKGQDNVQLNPSLTGSIWLCRKLLGDLSTTDPLSIW